MSLHQDSSVVCQIPDCTTTRAEIEFELKTFLSSFCTVCKQDRNGKLCGCAFPCSLTFRAHMLNKIHELLGVEKPSSRKAIQVCFKHPDLLKQAREACVAKRQELCTSARARRFDRPMTSSSTSVTSPVGAATLGSETLRDDHEIKIDKMAFRSMLNVGSEQRTDGASTSGTATPPEFCEPEPEISDDSEFEEFEDFARRKFAEIDRQKFAGLDREQSVKMTKILFSLGNENESESFSDEEFSDINCEKGRVAGNCSTQLDVRTEPRESETFNFNSPENFVADENESICSVAEDNETPLDSRSNNPTSGQTSSQKGQSQKLFRIKYQHYHASILMRGLLPLLHKSFLNDVQFVCRDGHVMSSSLLLGSMSPFLRDILSDVPIVDKAKVIIINDVNTSDLETFLNLLFAEDATLHNLTDKEARKVQTLAYLFKIDSILIAAKRPGRPRGSTNKSKLRPTKGATLVEPETTDCIFEVDEASDFASSDVDKNRLKRSRCGSELEPNEGEKFGKSERKDILNILDLDSTKAAPQQSQVSDQAPTYAISSTKYPNQTFSHFQMPSTSNSRECTKGGSLLSQSSNSVPCYTVSSSKYQDPVAPMYQITPSTSDCSPTSYSVQNQDVNTSCENNFPRNKFN